MCLEDKKLSSNCNAKRRKNLVFLDLIVVLSICLTAIALGYIEIPGRTQLFFNYSKKAVDPVVASVGEHSKSDYKLYMRYYNLSLYFVLPGILKCWKISTPATTILAISVIFLLLCTGFMIRFASMLSIPLCIVSSVGISILIDRLSFSSLRYILNLKNKFLKVTNLYKSKFQIETIVCEQPIKKNRFDQLSFQKNHRSNVELSKILNKKSHLNSITQTDESNIIQSLNLKKSNYTSAIDTHEFKSLVNEESNTKKKNCNFLFNFFFSLSGISCCILSYLVIFTGVYLRLSEACSSASFQSYKQLLVPLNLDENGQNITRLDHRDVYAWVKNNTAENAVIASLWDYGYYITGLSQRTSVVDNRTWSSLHIKTINILFLSPIHLAWQDAHKLNINYIIVPNYSEKKFLNYVKYALDIVDWPVGQLVNFSKLKDINKKPSLSRLSSTFFFCTVFNKAHEYNSPYCKNLNIFFDLEYESDESFWKVLRVRSEKESNKLLQ